VVPLCSSCSSINGCPLKPRHCLRVSHDLRAGIPWAFASGLGPLLRLGVLSRRRHLLSRALPLAPLTFE
jgi:hypothetical protein